MTKKPNRLALATLVLCALPAAAAHAQQDKIVTKDGKEKTVKILSEDYDGLKLSVEGGSTTTPWKDVDSIRYGNAAKYQEAIDAFASESPSQVLPKLEELAADDKLRAVLRHGVLYHLGLTHRRLGNDDKALAAFEQLLKDFPKTRYLVNIGTNVLSLYIAKGDPSGADKALKATLESARSASTDFLKGRILEEQKKFTDAERMFQAVITSAAGDADLALTAKLALARCAQRSGTRNKEAQDKYREIVGMDAPNEVLAGAWNGLGDLALDEGTKNRKQDDLRYAMFAYLRGVVLYVPERGGSTDEFERALAGAAKAFRAVGDLENDATKKKQFYARAQSLRDRLAQEYPRSRFLEENAVASRGSPKQEEKKE